MSLTTGERGVTVTPVVNGAVLFTVTLSVPESTPPSESVAVAVHTILSEGEDVELVRDTLLLVPRMLDPLVHT